MKRHLVTGGSGFLGNLIARRLLERGEKVRILDIWKDPNCPKEIEFIQCDIRDRNGVAKAMKNIDVVHHNVALVPLTKSGKKFWEVNVEGSRIAAEEAVRANIEYFIHMSSSAIYGAPQKCPVNENTPYNPIEIYGRGKLAGENIVRSVFEKANMPLVLIRPRTILGEGRLGIFQILFEWIKENHNVYVIGKGENLFQFVHAHDLMDAYMLVMDHKKSGAYNVGTDQFSTLKKALEDLIQFAQSYSKVKTLPQNLTINTLRLLDWLKLSPLAPWHYLTYHKPFYFDVTPLLNLGWKPKYSNQAMLTESYQWFTEHFDEMKYLKNKEASAHRKPALEKILKLVKKFS